jgi:membrane-bound metal-dependent hydrolase YbcI (DUF457 family)
MLSVNHLVAGAVIGRLSKNHPLIGLAAGVGSHLLLDSLPHWGLEASRPNRQEYFLRVAKTDGIAGLAMMGAFTLLSKNRVAMLCALAGSVLPDIDHPLSYFTGKTISPKPFATFHVSIQNGKESEARLPQEVLTATLGAALVGMYLWKSRASKSSLT